jgi:hypothetical protein
MLEYIGKKMIVDTDGADGGAYFEKEALIWKARDLSQQNRNFEIKYSDIRKITTYNSIKKQVVLTLADGSERSFYMYRSGTFVELVKAGIEANKYAESHGSIPLSNADLDRLSKLNGLHKEGVLSDEQFEFEKNEIMKKYK